MQGSRRWLRRIAWNLLLLALLLLVLGMLAVLNLTPLSLWAANHFLPAWRFHVSRVTVEARGALTIRELSVQLRRDGGEVLSVRKARAAFSWRELFKSRLFAVDLDGLRVVANDGALEEVQTILAGKSSSQPRWQIDRLTVKNGSAKVALAEQPEFDSRFDFKIFSLGEKSAAGKVDAISGALAHRSAFAPNSTGLPRCGEEPGTESVEGRDHLLGGRGGVSWLRAWSWVPRNDRVRQTG